MFGRRAKGQPDHEEEVEVDITLEQDISMVVEAVDNYLQNPNECTRKDLLGALEELDDQIAQGDDYHARLVFPFAAPESTVVGATSPSSVGEELPATEFQAQVALVKSAKDVVRWVTPDTLADLRDCSEALAAWRCSDH